MHVLVEAVSARGQVPAQEVAVALAHCGQQGRGPLAGHRALRSPLRGRGPPAVGGQAQDGLDLFLEGPEHSYGAHGARLRHHQAPPGGAYVQLRVHQGHGRHLAPPGCAPMLETKYIRGTYILQ